VATSFPPSPPQDDSISFTFWAWANKIWNWVLGATNVEVIKTAAFTADSTHNFYPVDPTGGSFNVTLPPANSCLGKKYIFKRVDVASANVITLVPQSSDTISPQVLSIPKQTYEIISDGVSKWYVVATFFTGIGTPGGSTTQVQFNDGGVFGGSANFVYDKTNNILTVGKVKLGSWVPDATFAFLGNNLLDQTVAGNYAILQYYTGQTFVNAATGQTINLRINNADIVFINTTGLTLTTAGLGFSIKEGSNARMGTATLVLGVSVVSNTSVTANSRIFLSVESLGTVTVPTTVAVTARTAGTSFTITSSNLTDTSVVAWFMMEPS
jgi:hypothetical protein